MHVYKSITLAVCLIISFMASALANDWTGDWNSNFGQLRLIQTGERLYGDYQNRGVIEGKVSADGSKARAVFVYNDGKWGTIEWIKNGERIKGSWNWSKDALANSSSGKAWTATRERSRTSAFKFARPSVVVYPTGDPNFTEKDVQRWIDAVVGSGTGVSQNARSGLSALYGGYSLSGLGQSYDIEVEVIHYEGSNTAGVDISIYRGSEHNCPAVMHAEFCEELIGKFNDRGFVDVQTTGTRIINRGQIGETIEATFRLPGDRNDRILRLNREATYFGASVHHNDRGYDYSAYANGRPHLCENAQCQDAVFLDVKNNPNKYRGNVDRGYIVRTINLPNDIEVSHNLNIDCCAPMPPHLSPNASSMSGSFVILDETSENLGTIILSPDGSNIAASGVLRGFFETGTDHDTVFTLVSQTDEALAFDLDIYAGQSGETKSGRIIFEIAGKVSAGNATGTLIADNEIFLIELVKPIRGVDPKDVGDVPAIGIYSVKYSFHQVPANRSIKLRLEPNRNSGVSGEISTNAAGLDMMACTPDIDSLRFQEADQNTRIRLLSSVWCQITNSQIAGWVPGRYLFPE